MHIINQFSLEHLFCMKKLYPTYLLTCTSLYSKNITPDKTVAYLDHMGPVADLLETPPPPHLNLFFGPVWGGLAV